MAFPQSLQYAYLGGMGSISYFSNQLLCYSFDRVLELSKENIGGSRNLWDTIFILSSLLLDELKCEAFLKQEFKKKPLDVQFYFFFPKYSSVEIII